MSAENNLTKWQEYTFYVFFTVLHIKIWRIFHSYQLASHSLKLMFMTIEQQIKAKTRMKFI